MDQKLHQGVYRQQAMTVLYTILWWKRRQLRQILRILYKRPTHRALLEHLKLMLLIIRIEISYQINTENEPLTPLFANLSFRLSAIALLVNGPTRTK